MKSILMKSAMSAAIAADIKTETRRLMHPQPPPKWGGTSERAAVLKTAPYQPGDILWVREEHYLFGHWEPVPGGKTRGGKQKWRFVADQSTPCRFDADTLPCRPLLARPRVQPEQSRWYKRLARFMPRSLSRLTLEVIEVKAERVQDITESAAWAEGITANRRLFSERMPLQTLSALSVAFPATDIGRLAADDSRLFDFGADPSQRTDYEKVVAATGRACFAYLWESIHGPGAWARNEWVWAVQFKRLAA